MVAPSYGLHKPEQVHQLKDLIANSPEDKLLSMVPGSKQVPRHKREWFSDPMNLGWVISPHTLGVNLRAMATFRETMPAPKCSTLIIRGGEDKVVSNKAIEAYYDSLPASLDKAIITFDEAGHDVLEDKEALV